jgi:hypothetical protein
MPEVCLIQLEYRTMSFEGHIQNGVVVFKEPITIPEGTAVRVEVITPPRKTLAERFKNVIGAGVDLPEDLAKNHDHYLHGTPKQ